MRPKVWMFVLSAALGSACGFGFADDSGNPIPATDYWGWQCADGSTPDPDAGCPPPGPCDDGTYPSFADGGACTCDDGTVLTSSDCQAPDGG
jgi:hypothetical protein